VDAEETPRMKVASCHVCARPSPLHSETCIIGEYLRELDAVRRLQALKNYAVTHGRAAIATRVAETARRGLVEDAWVIWGKR